MNINTIQVVRSWTGDTYFLPTEEIKRMVFKSDKDCVDFIKSKYGVDVTIVEK